MSTTSRPRRKRERAAPAALSELPLEEQRDKAREAALRLLSVRDRSLAELTSRLRQKGFRPDVVDGVLARLEETGLIDDRRFAERFAADAARGRGMAGARIRRELLGKGIERELAVVAATERPEVEEERARELAARQARRMSSLDGSARYRRLAGMLARRGYAPDIVMRVARDYAGELPEEPR